MSSVRSFVSLVGVLAGLAGLTGCFDLSADGSPTPEDFNRNRTSSARPQGGQDPAASPPECHEAACLTETLPMTLRKVGLPPLQRTAEQLEAAETDRASGGARLIGD